MTASEQVVAREPKYYSVKRHLLDLIGTLAPGEPDADVSAAETAVRTLVVRAREDLEIAAGVERALSGSAR